ncbi:MAG: hypothetical protein Q9225_004939 [Loekoesia sp. 1 TL-2023]
MLSPLANGKLVVCLEGGYNLGSISKSALAVTRTLLGEPPDRIIETTPTKSGAATVDMRGQLMARRINYADAVPLIIFFHDPYHHQIGPEVTRLADAELNDTLNWYREWAINEGFAIIDVNFPNHVAEADVCPPLETLTIYVTDNHSQEVDDLDYDKDIEHAKHMAERAELAIYLWENYIE